MVVDEYTIGYDIHLIQAFPFNVLKKTQVEKTQNSKNSINLGKFSFIVIKMLDFGYICLFYGQNIMFN